MRQSILDLDLSEHPSKFLASPAKQSAAR